MAPCHSPYHRPRTPPGATQRPTPPGGPPGSLLHHLAADLAGRMQDGVDVHVRMSVAHQHEQRIERHIYGRPELPTHARSENAREPKTFGLARRVQIQS